MGPTANNWGGGYGEMNTNMNNMMNQMNSMARDNGVRLAFKNECELSHAPLIFNSHLRARQCRG